MKPKTFYAVTSIIGFILSVLFVCFIITYMTTSGKVEGSTFVLTLFLGWCVSLLPTFVVISTAPIKIGFVSSLIKNPKSPVYLYEEDCIKKYVVDYDSSEVPAIALMFPPILMLQHQALVLERTEYISENQFSNIEKGLTTPRAVFEDIVRVKEGVLSEKELRKRRLIEINKDYYNNFR